VICGRYLPMASPILENPMLHSCIKVGSHKCSPVAHTGLAAADLMLQSTVVSCCRVSWLCIPPGTNFTLVSELIQAGIDIEPKPDDVWPDTQQERFIPSFDFRVRDVTFSYPRAPFWFIGLFSCVLGSSLVCRSFCAVLELCLPAYLPRMNTADTGYGTSQ
jgi:hypothetical protein